MDILIIVDWCGKSFEDVDQPMYADIRQITNLPSYCRNRTRNNPHSVQHHSSSSTKTYGLRGSHQLCAPLRLASMVLRGSASTDSGIINPKVEGLPFVDRFAEIQIILSPLDVLFFVAPCCRTEKKNLKRKEW